MKLSSTKNADHCAWLEVTPPWLRDEGQGGFIARFEAAYTTLTALVQPSLPLLPVLGASGGAGEQVRDDTPERLSVQDAAKAFQDWARAHAAAEQVAGLSEETPAAVRLAVQEAYEEAAQVMDGYSAGRLRGLVRVVEGLG
ncbi:hypothetical protein [Deinococcus sp. Leaf326]|uniref:hypothetical protein n=1 Tax=Deinococcus sp. Leaf326 TaxID=1736338 RepID=UPI0006F5D6A7|nr:hypothetical protein [Deinococcus sp. Leaf326]KQR33101.1 hypothetical protein ASF71_16550 [Deinococcus sp. Leaf326]